MTADEREMWVAWGWVTLLIVVLSVLMFGPFLLVVWMAGLA